MSIQDDGRGQAPSQWASTPAAGGQGGGYASQFPVQDRAPMGAPPALAAPAAPQPAQQSAAANLPGIMIQSKPARIGSAQEMQPGDLDVSDALRMMLRVGASDLHLTTGAPPMVRLDGQLAALPGMDVLKPDSLRRSLYSMLTQKQREKFEEDLELDFSHALVCLLYTSDAADE